MRQLSLHVQFKFDITLLFPAGQYALEGEHEVRRQ